MLDFNLFTFNGKAFPGTEPLVVPAGRPDAHPRSRNLSMTSHPDPLHGHQMWVTETDGGQIPRSAWWPETTINVLPGTTRAFEFVADNPGDWALHCHKTHHAMNAMGHDIPNVLGVDQTGVSQRDARRLVPGYMAMGVDRHGRARGARRAHARPAQHAADDDRHGPFGPIEMGGMFTVLKIRDGLASYEDPGWYDYPPGTVAWKVGLAPGSEPEKERGHGTVGRWVIRLLALVGLVAITGVLGFVAIGLSSRSEPPAIEVSLARAARRLMIPSAARNATNPLPPAPELHARALRHWADHCASCHGNGGKGKTSIGRNLYPRAPDMTLAATQ